MTVNCHVLLGGMTGGLLDRFPGINGGMNDLVRMMAPRGAKTWTWGDWQKCWADIRNTWHPGTQIVIIGYSGGGWCGTLLCNALKPAAVALFVAYDPSPAGSLQPISNNVRRACCYFNTKPAMWWPGVGQIGGGRIVSDGSTPAPTIETRTIAMQHLLVQYDKALHRHTIDLINHL